MKKHVLPAFFIPAFCLSFALLMFGFSQKSYANETNGIDFSDPKSVVTAASRMVMDSDYAGMLQITEMAEKRRALEIVNSIESNLVTRADLQKEADKILGFEIAGVEYVTNGAVHKLCLVSTRWMTKMESFKPRNTAEFTPMDPSRDPETQRSKKSNSTIIYVDYLLKQFDGKWKIVSRKSR